jgi:hypothetical protein
MKKSLFKILVLLNVFLLLNIFSNNLFSQTLHCHHEFANDITIIDGTNDIYPGDTICLLSGNKDFLLLRNIHGTADSIITIINKDCPVIINTEHFYGIKFDLCSYIKLTGSGLDALQYGIQITKVENGAGLSIDHLSTNIEIERAEIANSPIAGIYAKTEPDYLGNCSFIAVRDSFTMYNTVIHDCYLHNIGNEGMYIGSSKYMGQYIYNCDTTVLPHVLIGVKIYNNILEDIGWDGIQVSSAVSDCEIYNNYILHDSYAEENFQMSGILIGGGSNCDCYNNKIIDGKGDGIDLMGLGNQKLFNNLIVNPGKTYHPNDPPTEYKKHGIWVGDVFTYPNENYYFFNNTIISPRTFGIKLANEVINENIVYNNIIVDPGAFQTVGEEAYINLANTFINLISSNNYFTTNSASVNFVDEASGNYDLKPSSPAVNSGLDLSAYGITFDIENRTRPFDNYFDIGAYECQTLSDIPAYLFNEQGINLNNYPNPVKNKTKIFYFIPENTFVNISIYNSIGKKIEELVNQDQKAGEHIFNFNATDLPYGIFYYTLKTTKASVTNKMIKLQ